MKLVDFGSTWDVFLCEICGSMDTRSPFCDAPMRFSRSFKSIFNSICNFYFYRKQTTLSCALKESVEVVLSRLL